MREPRHHTTRAAVILPALNEECGLSANETGYWRAATGSWWSVPTASSSPLVRR